MVLYLKKYPNDQWIIKINENSDAVFSCLGEKCYLKNKKEKYVKSEEKAVNKKVETKKREVIVDEPE